MTRCGVLNCRIVFDKFRLGLGLHGAHLLTGHRLVRDGQELCSVREPLLADGELNVVDKLVHDLHSTLQVRVGKVGVGRTELLLELGVNQVSAVKRLGVGDGGG
jgi:hypothetical protein